MSAFDAPSARLFARVDEFLGRLRLLSPWGRDEFEKRKLLDDPREIESRLDDIEAAIAWQKEATPRREPRSDSPSTRGDTVRRDLAAYHLGRIPRIPLAPSDAYEIVELFQFKKFLHNLGRLAEAVGEPMARRFGIVPPAPGGPAAGLADALSLGGAEPETFRISEAYDPRLSLARAAIAAADRLIDAERSSAEAIARDRFGIEFDGREFVVAPAALADALQDSGLPFSIEPYDLGRRVVRAIPSRAASIAMVEREAQREDERIAEADVIRGLSALASAALPELRLTISAIARWDRARAAAESAEEFGLVRPTFGSAAVELDAGRFVPLEDECRRLGLRYEPLSARFKERAAALFGSNMGGKTVVLKTILFFQILAQSGLFVPAARFSTRVFGHIEYVGEEAGGKLAGLSGFGHEMSRLAAAMEAGASPCGAMVAYDELCRTTGSAEAEAILSAVIEAYAAGLADRPLEMDSGDRARGNAGSPGFGDRAYAGFALFATHYRGVARLPGAEYWKMLGLDKEAAKRGLIAEEGQSSPARPMSEPIEGGQSSVEARPGSASSIDTRRLAEINNHMRYRLVVDDGSDNGSDALAIASFLGLDDRLLERARSFLESVEVGR